MTNTDHLLARVRARIGKSSKYALAKALEMTPAHLNHVLNGKSGLGPKAVVRIAELTGIPTHDVLVLVQEDKAKTPEEKEFWGRRSPRITASVAVAAVAFYAAVSGQDAQAKDWTNSQYSAYRSIHYAKYPSSVLGGAFARS